MNRSSDRCSFTNKTKKEMFFFRAGSPGDIHDAQTIDDAQTEPESLQESCDKYWAEMTKAEQMACKHLGWTQDSWDNAPEDEHPAPLNRDWESLSSAAKSS